MNMWKHPTVMPQSYDCKTVMPQAYDCKTIVPLPETKGWIDEVEDSTAGEVDKI